jgi:DNA-binding MarR family transcriptional regulator
MVRRPAAPLLRLLSSSFKRSRARLQRELDEQGVHAGQDYLIELLSEEDGLTVGEIAERIGIEVPTVVRTVQRMEANGLVAKQRDPRDRRRSSIVLTERGRAVEPAVRAALRDIERTAMRGLSAAEREQLLDLLTRVRTNLGDRT